MLLEIAYLIRQHERARSRHFGRWRSMQTLVCSFCHLVILFHFLTPFPVTDEKSFKIYASALGSQMTAFTERMKRMRPTLKKI